MEFRASPVFDPATMRHKLRWLDSRVKAGEQAAVDPMMSTSVKLADNAKGGSRLYVLPVCASGPNSGQFYFCPLTIYGAADLSVKIGGGAS